MEWQNKRGGNLEEAASHIFDESNWPLVKFVRGEEVELAGCGSSTRASDMVGIGKKKLENDDI